METKTDTLIRGCCNTKIPEGTIALADYAFSSAPGLGNIVIPSSLQKIGNHCFENCVELKNVHLPKTVQWIGSCAFAECTCDVGVAQTRPLFAKYPKGFNESAFVFFKGKVHWGAK